MLLPSGTDGMSECCASTTTRCLARVACETNATGFLRAWPRARRVGPMRRARSAAFSFIHLH